MMELEDKIITIEAEMEKIVQSRTSESVWATHYGAFDIDPKHLVYKICLKSDAERIRLANNVGCELCLTHISIQNKRGQMCISVLNLRKPSIENQVGILGDIGDKHNMKTPLN